MQRKNPAPSEQLPARHGLARVISKLGIASRTQAAELIVQGLVRVNGKRVRDAEFPVRQGVDRIEIEGRELAEIERVVVMLNKPRGLLTTSADDLGRETVYSCLHGSDLPWLAPVGRLDKASEGLLLLSNDPAWAARVTSPESGPRKTYHVQVDCIPEPAVLALLLHGIGSEGEWLRASSARLLRHGQKNAWLEIILDEGRNRQIRRLLDGFGISTLRLVRVAIGPLELGNLGKGQWRRLDAGEVARILPSS